MPDQAKPICRWCRSNNESNEVDVPCVPNIDYSEEIGNINLFCPICVHVVQLLKGYLEKFGAVYKSKKFRKESGISCLTIAINSEGGDTEQGLAIYDLIKFYSRNFPIKTVALGQVVSAALVVYLAGSERYTFPNAFFLTHDSSAEPDQNGELKKAEWYYQRGRTLRLLNQVYARIILANSNLTPRKLRNLKNQERLISAKEAVKYGLAHEIIRNH